MIGFVYWVIAMLALIGIAYIVEWFWTYKGF